MCVWERECVCVVLLSRTDEPAVERGRGSGVHCCSDETSHKLSSYVSVCVCACTCIFSWLLLYYVLLILSVSPHSLSLSPAIQRKGCLVVRLLCEAEHLTSQTLCDSLASAVVGALAQWRREPEVEIEVCALSLTLSLSLSLSPLPLSLSLSGACVYPQAQCCLKADGWCSGQEGPSPATLQHALRLERGKQGGGGERREGGREGGWADLPSTLLPTQTRRGGE